MSKFVAAAAVAVCAGFALASPLAETAQYAGSHSIDLWGNAVPSIQNRLPVVYDNLAAPSAAAGAFSSTDLNATLGDRLNTTGTGTLDAFTFTLFNSSTGNTGALTSAVVELSFFRGVDGSGLGSFQVNTGTINLNAGFFTTLNVTGLTGLGINLDTTDIIVTQRVVSLVGTTTRLGAVNFQPGTVGSSDPTIFIQASTVNGGTAGFYNITSGGVPVDFDLGYTVSVPAPGALALLGAAGLVSARRRRA